MSAPEAAALSRPSPPTTLAVLKVTTLPTGNVATVVEWVGLAEHVLHLVDALRDFADDLEGAA